MAAVHEHGGFQPPSEETVAGLIDANARWRYRILRFFLIPLFRILFRIEVRGRANIPAEGRYVVIANHLNWPDAPLLLVAFPITPRINFVGDTTFVNESVLQWLFIRQVGGVLPLVSHGHGCRWAVHVIRTCLDKGGLVGFFPEGRYGDGEAGPGPFHRGFATVAIAAGVPVLPVRLCGTKVLWFRKRLVVEIGEPIHPEGHTAETLAAATRDQIRNMPLVEAAPRGLRLLSGWLTRLFD